MNIKELVVKNRSYRRFYEEEKIDDAKLKSFVELVRYCGSGMNAQSLKYILVNNDEDCEKVFNCLGWAGYLKNWDGPKKGERPVAYIVQLHDESLAKNYFCDDGIQLQTILLAAVESGYGGCIVKNVKKDLNLILNVPEDMKIIQVLALGKPKEKIHIVDMKENDFKYWRDDNDEHYVPKRTIDELIIK